MTLTNRLLLLKIFSCFVLLFSSIGSSYGQGKITSLKSSSISKGKVYALIIGISDYKDKNIPDLQYAHRDAKEFSDYLRSKAGGSIPSAQIKLLTGQQATVANIYNAKKWLEKSAKKGDFVFFYYAGHGDVESDLYELGFLLAYDTPEKNYLNNAIRIEDINNMANTLSVNQDVTTVLITDACHSGKLVGQENKGKGLVGGQLSKVQKNEVRLASCAADERSEEDLAWGDGRGVFSYYLLQGLSGIADSEVDPNGEVTLGELEAYLKITVPVQARDLKKADQNPVVDGKPSTVLSVVNASSLAEARKRGSSAKGATSGKSRSVDEPLTAMQHFFELLRSEKIEEKMDFSSILRQSAAESSKQLSQCFYLQENELKILQNSLQKPSVQVTMVERVIADLPALKASLLDSVVRNEFEQEFVVILHDRVQQVLNLYLEGDRSELERRNSLNNARSLYDDFPKMLKLGLQLTDSTNHLHHLLEVKLHYFNGIAYRLKLAQADQYDSLYRLALKEQKLALGLDEQAAYVHNELGLLYLYKKDYVRAETHFKRATDLVPLWALPYANLSGVYSETTRWEQGVAAAKKAITLQSDYAGSYINLGANYIKMGNLLLAEEALKKGNTLDPKDYVALKKLGELYTTLTHYKLAEEHYFKADAMKVRNSNSSVVNKTRSKNQALAEVLAKKPLRSLPEKPSPSFAGIKNTIMANFVAGKQAYDFGQYSEASTYFKRTLILDSVNPIAYRYLGELKYRQGSYLEAEQYLMLARAHYLDSASFAKHLVVAKRKSTPLAEINTKVYENSYYLAVEIDFLMAALYTMWKHHSQSIQCYEQIIRKNPQAAVAYLKLWQLHEQLADFESAESVLRSFTKISKSQGERELHQFYDKRLSAAPNNPTYLAKAINFLYTLSTKTDQQLVINDYDQDPFASDAGQDPEKLSTLIVPGTKEEVMWADSIVQTQERGIQRYIVTYLKQEEARIGSGGLLPEDMELGEATKRLLPELRDPIHVLQLAQLYSKMGDLEGWSGSVEKSAASYEIAIALDSSDAATREKLIEKRVQLFQYQAAMSQLDLLYGSSQISYGKLQHYARYQIYSGMFVKADTLLQQAQDLLPYAQESLLELKGIKALLAKNYKTAQVYYQMLLDKAPNNANLWYTMCRIQTQLQKPKIALNSLNEAIKNGFKNKWVLDNDTMIFSLRKQNAFKTMRSNMQL